MKVIRISGLGLLLLILAACDKLGQRERPTIPLSYSLEGIKRIDRGSELGNDLTSYRQSTYTVTPANRLLMRFESLSKHEANVNLSKPIKVELAVVSDRTQASAHLQLCPITRQWMMLATWSLAHPFGGEGNWGRPGGDYDATLCFKGTAKEEKLLTFDVTRWYMNYVVGRQGINYGLILLSAGEVTIEGDLSGSFSPRILFDEYQKSAY